MNFLTPTLQQRLALLPVYGAGTARPHARTLTHAQHAAHLSRALRTPPVRFRRRPAGPPARWTPPRSLPDPTSLHGIAQLSDLGASFVPGGAQLVGAGDKALAALGIGGPMADVIHNPLLAQLALIPGAAGALVDVGGAVGDFFGGLFGGGAPIPVVPDPTGAFSREEMARMPGRIHEEEN